MTQIIYQNSASTNGDYLEYALIANRICERYVTHRIGRLMQAACEPPAAPEPISATTQTKND